MKKITVLTVLLMMLVLQVAPVFASPPHTPHGNGYVCSECWLPKPHGNGIRGGCWGILCTLLGCCDKAFPADQAGQDHGTPSNNPHGPL
jgi:hypothetical protein